MTTPSAGRVDAATEALYALLPAHIRSVDAGRGSALKALIRVLASGSLEMDREIDRLYDSMFVETAPEQALAELAALVASEPLRPLPPGSSLSARTFIANTVRYRRGKGTARVLESLAADVGGFGAVAVEYFMRLARLQHLIDVRPERRGTALLVPGTTAALTATGFDMLPRLVDVRSIASTGGRHHVPHVGVHVLRPVVPNFPAPVGSMVDADDMAGVPIARPWPDGLIQHAGYFQLAAQPGRVLRLFNPNRRSQTQADRVVDTDLPDRLRRLPLHLETRELRHAAIEGRQSSTGDAPWFDANGQPFTIFLRYAGATTFTRVAPSEILIANLEAFPASPGARPAPSTTHSWFTEGANAPVLHTGTHLIRCAFDPMTGRLIVAQPAATDPDAVEVRVAYGTGIGREIGAGSQDRNTVHVPFDIIDTDSVTHFLRIVDATKPETGATSALIRRVQTLDKALSEWSASDAGRRGLIVLARCDREGAVGGATSIAVAVHPGSELHIVSAQWRAKVIKPGLPDNLMRHGYVVRRDRRFTVDAPVVLTAASAPPPDGRPGVLILDGLELTGGISLGAHAVTKLCVRHCTVRAPGGTAIATTGALDAELTIDRSIVGGISIDPAAGATTGDLVIVDSIVSKDEGGGNAISAAPLDAYLKNVTVFGSSAFKSLEATNAIFVEPVTVTRRQTGCVRYSWIPHGSAAPRRFRCQPDLAIAVAAGQKGLPLTTAERATIELGVTPLFLDTSLDEPTVAMLHPLTRDAIRLGGENDTEMGVFSDAAEGLRKANLTSQFDDYVPFGLQAAVIDDTRSSAVAVRRNRP